MQTDVVELSEELLNHSPTCECEFITYQGSETCSNPAEWWGVDLCCGQQGLYCQSCKDRADCVGDFRQWLNVCARCGVACDTVWRKV